ncbi:uncharacterized protein LOC116296686 isoform X2 [Actinia tenebrosa]|nr:uncharacterized protein LOC116296686 isoform X2 [Actinia tenebrosa]
MVQVEMHRVPSDMVQVEMQAPRNSQLLLGVDERNVGQRNKQVRTAGVTNSSRWTDVETRHLLEVWGKRYSSLRFKKRNFKDWEIIAREFNKRCETSGIIGLGPRMGAQCKIRIKNIIADYKRMKGQYSGHNSRQLFPFFETIDQIIGNSKQGRSHQANEQYSREEFKADEIVHLDLPEEATEQPTSGDVTIATAAIAVPVSADSVPENTTAIHEQNSTVGTLVGTHMTKPVLSFSTTPSFHPNTSVTVNHVPLPSPQASGIVTQFNVTNPEPRRIPSSFAVSSQLQTFKRSSTGQPYTNTLQKKKLRKNPRPVKVVKVSRQAAEDDKLLAIVREFMEERRKREEELFHKLFQQQAEAEKRYQEFTLNVIKEIGRLFRPEAGN